ncbi:MAG: replicative DNA helicase [Tissierellales bacterium]|nr:replicative DNA helicase [Tissierellales bacterium]
MKLDGKVPPQSPESEKGILGSVLIDNESLFKITEKIKPDYFYQTKHRIIYRAMLELHESETPIDLITLSDTLRKNNKLESIGGAVYLAEISDSVVSAAPIKSYAEILIEKYNLRRLREDVYGLLGMIENGHTSHDIYEKMGSCSIQHITDHRQFDLSEILHQTCETIDRRKEGELHGLTTGIEGLDGLLDFEYGDLVIIGGYPSHGKSSMAVQIALHTIMNLKKQVLFFELEMTRQRLATRLLAMQGRFSNFLFWKGKLSEEETAKANRAFNELVSAPLVIDDTPGVPVSYIKAKSKRLKQKHDLKMVIIDYLQLIDTTKQENREQAISMVTKNLKAMAKELGIVVILLSQFHRHEGTRTNRKPTMFDLKGSGAIEQDADKIILTWLPNLKKSETALGFENRYKARLLVEKHREGSIFEVDMNFNRDYTKFE